MEDEKKHRSKKHKHHRGDHEDDQHKTKRRRKDHSQHGESSKEKKRKSKDIRVVDDDVDDADMWEEKNVDMDGERITTQDIPTQESLKLTSHATEDSAVSLPISTHTESSLKRDDWMLDPLKSESNTAGPSSSRGDSDFFSNLGTEFRKRPPIVKPIQEPVISSMELNTTLLGDTSTAESTPPPPAKPPAAGGPGSQWRMMRLRRVFESAEEEGRSIEEVAVERFGSLSAFEEAKEERRILDEREGKRGRPTSSSKPAGHDGPRGFMFTDIGGSGASSRSSSFRRPDVGGSMPATPTPSGLGNKPHLGQLGSTIRSPAPGGTASPAGRAIPSVMTPSQGLKAALPRALSPNSLNKLQAKVLRAKLMGAPNAEELEKEYEREMQKSSGLVTDDDGSKTRVEVLPTHDIQGRLYDIGRGKEETAVLPGNRKEAPHVETHDPKTGEIVRYNADDDETSLGDMLREERFGAGMADQKNLDAEFARAILSDGKFENDLEYMDDNAEKLGRKKMRSDAMRRQFAINDYKKTQTVLATCPMCFGEDDSPPKAPVVAMGTRVYLSCTLNEELVPGHCLIVPIQHHLTMLEGDDDVWDEVRNFMKCLMRMFAEQDKGVIFYETVISLKWQKHTVIECVPLSWDKFEEMPGYFRESILMSEAEWSQHKKVIDFSARPGGFRRAMVPNLPYFMVQFDYKGEKGYGHVIEGQSEAFDEDDAQDDGDKGSEFPRWFAAEIIGNILDVEPRKWRRPKRIDLHRNQERVKKFRASYDQFDWTGMIGKQ